MAINFDATSHSGALYERFIFIGLRSYLLSLQRITLKICDKITTEALTALDSRAHVTEMSELPHFGEQTRKSRFLAQISEAKGSCSKTLDALDLLENYVCLPSVETANPLKLLFEHEKSICGEPLTPDQFEPSHIVRTKGGEAGDEPKKAQDSNQKIENCESKTFQRFSGFSTFCHKKEIISLVPVVENMTCEGWGQAYFTSECKACFFYSHEIDVVSEYADNSSRDDEERITSEKSQQVFQLKRVNLELKGQSLEQNQYPQILQKKIENIQEENSSLKEHLKLLHIEHRETLGELGRLMVENAAEENIKRKSEKNLGVFRFSKVARKTDCSSICQDRNESTGAGANLNEAAVQGAEAFVETNHFERGEGSEEMVMNVKSERVFREEERQNKASKNLEKGKKDGGKGFNKSEEEIKEKTPSGLVSSSAKGSENDGLTREAFENLSFSVQQDSPNDGDYISLSNQPSASESVATTLYYNYKLLLLTLAERLLSSEAEHLKNWASQNFSIDTSQEITDVIFQLDRKEIINASDLSRLKNFFESILRIDLVYIIDAFLLGDYDVFRIHQRKPEVNSSREKKLRERARSSHTNPLNGASSHSATSQNDAPERRTENNAEVQTLIPNPPCQTPLPRFLENQDTTTRKHASTYQDHDPSSIKYGLQNLTPNFTGLTDARFAEDVVADGPVTRESRLRSGNSSTSANRPVNQRRNTQTVGSNGFKLSKARQPDTAQSNSRSHRNQVPDDEVQGNWLCSHYKRRCFVKFECCDKFWPCHRCHNNQSTCGRKKLKSRDTEKLKCANCSKVQEFGQYCQDCNAKFAMYYCGLCKHLTGTDDHPYHCEKCGICRIHGDRSFHCDICGVCLDVQLRGNHKCRAGSAHDECCICLEDAFTGCQILPCSHKVHKECATQMIRSGIRRCPICRESFAHKLERRPMSDRMNRSGK